MIFYCYLSLMQFLMMSSNADDGFLRFGDGDGDGGGGGDAVDVSLMVPFAVALAVDGPIWTANMIHYYFSSVVVVYHLFSLFFVPQFLYFYFHENSLTTRLGPRTWYAVGGSLEGR